MNIRLMGLIVANNVSANQSAWECQLSEAFETHRTDKYVHDLMIQTEICANKRDGAGLQTVAHHKRRQLVLNIFCIFHLLRFHGHRENHLLQGIKL